MATKNVEDFYPLTPMQQGMLFHSLYDPGSGVYVGQLSCTFRSDPAADATQRLDVAAFERAWQRVVERQPILRTGFVAGDLKEPVQVVHRRVTVALTQHDWRELPAEQQAAELQALLHADQARGFVLAEPPLMRLTLIQIDDNSHQFIWTYHHLLFDGWSLPLLLQEVFAYYEAFHSGRDLALPAPRPFRSYVAWLRKQDMAAAERFWRTNLRGFYAPTPLTVDRPPQPDAEAGHAELNAPLSPETSARLQALAREGRLTLNTLVQGAWALLLSRYSGEDDVVFGATVSGRPAELPGAEQLIGMLINTLPVRVKIDANMAVRDWLRALHSQQIELRQYEYSPLVQIQGWSELPRGVPLFDSLLVFENFPVSSRVQGGQNGSSSLRIEGIDDVQQTNFPLALIAYPGETIMLRIAYERARFDTATIERMLGHLRVLLEAFAAQPDAALGQLPLLTEAEHQQQAGWNDSARTWPDTRPLTARIAAHAATNPDAPALRFQGQSLSYGELHERASQLAAHLQSLGVGPEHLVAICADPSFELVVAVLAVMQSGAAFLPIDPSYPSERIQFMLEDAQPAVLLTDRSIADFRLQIADWAGQIYNLQSAIYNIAPLTSPNLPGLAPDALAYVIYTSGSTGRPKGTLLTQRGLHNLVEVVIEQFVISASSRVLQFAAFGFDAAVSEVVPALVAGATLVLAPRATLGDLDALPQLLRAEAVSVATLPPSLLAVLPHDDLPALATLVAAGEACPWEVAERWAAGRRFLNGYGPTEATIGVSYYPVTSRVPATTNVPLGYPVANTTFTIVNAHGQPQPIGVPGELLIGGVQLARGYLGRPELTAEKFVERGIKDQGSGIRDQGSGIGHTALHRLAPDPWPLTPDPSRLYRTGDRVRYLPNGMIEFLGRIDQQVKLRGFRIELGEIEARLGQHPAVAAAAVIVREDRPGDQRLVAYIVQNEAVRVENSAHESSTLNSQFSILNSQLSTFLKATLPAYMLPAAFVLLDAFPLTPNGKVDRKALPAPDASTSPANSYVAPRTPEEELLANAWTQVLGLAQVSIHDDFFALGGHSLLATQLAARLRDTFQIELPLRAVFEAPTIAELATVVETTRRSAGHLQAPPLLPAEPGAPTPLSFAQQRLWFLDQLEPGSALYNIPTALSLNGALDVAALEQSLQAVVKRHAALRTTIITSEGRPQQLVAPELHVPLTLIDMSQLPEAEREAAVHARLSTEARTPFDLAQGPLLRATLLKLGEQEHIGLFTVHHIIADGWSMNVLVREIAALYASYSHGQPATLPALPIQYTDYASWQRGWLQGDALAEHLAYWKRQLADAPALLNLPTDRPRPAVQSYNGASQSFILEPAVRTALANLSQQQGTTLFMTLLAAFQVLLARYTGQDDICIGTPIAGRTHRETEGLIGFFVNTLVIRGDLSGQPSFKALLKRVREAALAAYTHQDLPFEMVVDAVQPERNLSHSPLFQAMFVLQSNTQRAAIGTLQVADGLAISGLDVHSGTAKFDLTLDMNDGPDGLVASFEYNTDLFDQATMIRLIEHFRILLAAIIADPSQPISRLPLLSAAERHTLLVEWNNTAAPYPSDRCFHELFAAQAARTPTATAVVFNQHSLSYAELDARANQLAHYLRRLGVGPERLVGICAERSLELLVGLLGVLKAGAAYVPMDPGYPAERLAFMLEDAAVPVLLTQGHLTGRLPAHNAQQICLDDDWPSIAAEPVSAFDSGATPDNLAYIIYTSGSTGRPKGAMIVHRGLVNYLTWAVSAYDVASGQGAVVHSSIAFDLTITGLFAPLLAGRCVYLLPEEEGIEALGSALRQADNLSLVKITPAHLELLSQQLSAAQASGRTRAFIIGGENLLVENLRFWREHAPATRLVNEYGPTETVVGCCVYSVPLDWKLSGSVPIGKPIANTQLYVLDQHMQPTPIGVIGELYIGGDGVGRGYLNRPELTAERFVEIGIRDQGPGISAEQTPILIPDPRSPTPDTSRLYRTGDLARWRADGEMEFFGRIDHQVKIRGFRIELGEIEAVLGQHPAIKEAVVLAREDQPGVKRLVAYIVAGVRDQGSGIRNGDAAADLTPDPRSLTPDLRAFLKTHLPEYMVPAVFVPLAALPLTPNGKVDQRALPTPDTLRPELEQGYLAPRTPTEATLAAIWGQVLGLAQVGVHNNFFELGGDSILSIQVTARAQQAGLYITPRQFFQAPTVAGLAALAATAPQANAEQGLVTGDVPLTPIQHWFFEHHPLAPHHWNTSMMLEVAPGLDAALLAASVRFMLEHHDALRLRFRQVGGNWQQVNAPPGDDTPFQQIDLRHVPGRKLPAAIEAAAASIQASLDLEHGPLLRVAHINLGPQAPGRLLIVFHHLVIDGISLRIFLADLLGVYQQLARGEAAQLPAKTTAFQRWAQRLTSYAQSSAVQQQLGYWLALGAERLPPLPADFKHGTNTYGTSERLVVSLPTRETQALLRAVPAALGTQIDDALLTALGLAFAQWSGQTRLLVELDAHGRQDLFDDIDLSRTIGWFTTLYPVLLDVAGEPLAALRRVQASLAAVPARGIGYGLLRYSSNDPQVAGQMRELPQPQVSFNYLGQFDQLPVDAPVEIPFRIAQESPGTEHYPHNQRSAQIYVVGIVTGGELGIQWSYSPALHRRATIERLAKQFLKELRRLISLAGAAA